MPRKKKVDGSLQKVSLLHPKLTEVNGKAFGDTESRRNLTQGHSTTWKNDKRTFARLESRHNVTKVSSPNEILRKFTVRLLVAPNVDGS